jgi:hypothetical protein
MIALCKFLYNTLTKDILCPSCIIGASNKGAISYNTDSRTKSSKDKTVKPGLNSKSTMKYWSQINLMKRSLSLSCES